MFNIRIQAYELCVEIQSSEAYPDALNDICNRAVSAFTSAVATLDAIDIPIAGADQLPELDEDI